MSPQDELQAQPPKTAVADNIKERFLVLIVSVLSMSCVIVSPTLFIVCVCVCPFHHYGSHTFISVCINYQCRLREKKTHFPHI